MSWKELGLKCGVEIHQQLEGRKLFGPYPTKISGDNSYDFEVSRFIRAVAGESGTVDTAAAQEQKKQKFFTYRGSHESAGLIEIDEQPPIPISQEALYASLQFSILVDADIAPIIQVMRKTVADGSNTSGFQRTALVARAGILKTSLGEVGIDNVSLEEDSCRTLEETPDSKIYHLDRLGIPLIEIGTAPDIKTPEHAKEVCQLLGSYLRSLPNCKRGLGTIRQDVNVSIKGGERVEIKGAQDLKMVPTLIELEMKRQHELLELKKELKRKKIAVPKLQAVNLTDLLKKSTSKIIVAQLKAKGVVVGIKIVGYAGLLQRELQPGYRLGTELAGRVKVVSGLRGIFHSDELPNYGITEEEVKSIAKHLKCKADDAFIFVAGKAARCELAIEAIQKRLEELYVGIPKEVRKAQADGTTRYMRPMPGAARMYPETDVPLIYTNAYGAIKLPELLHDKAIRFAKEYKMSSDLANFIVKSSRVDLFEELVKKYPKMKAAFIAETLGPTLLGLKREYDIDPDSLTNKHLSDLFMYLDQDKIHKDIVIDVLIDMSKGKFSLSNYEGLSTEEIHKVIVDIVKKNAGAPFGALMGMSMKALPGKASGQVISKALKEIIEKGHK